MASNLTVPVFAALCCCVAVSLAHPVTVPTVVRLIPPSASSEGGLAKRFRAIRQSSQVDEASVKNLPRCSQRALDRATELEDACLSCATNVETGQVSECPEGCCRTFDITEDLETAQFITCYKGCCVRSIGVLSDSSDREKGDLIFEQVFVVNNDIKDGSVKRCGSSCALFTPKNAPCSNASFFQVPAFGESFADPPCTEAEGSPGSDDPGDDSASSSTGVAVGGGNGDDGTGDDMDGDDDLDADGDDDGDRDVGNGSGKDVDAIGPENNEDVGDDVDGAGITGDDDEDLEPSATEEVEESSPTEEPEGSTEEVEGNAEPTAEQGAGDETETDDPVCFPSEATVELMDGRKKRMEELKTDDMVLVGAEKYSRVFGFTHDKREYSGRFVELRMKSGHILRLTAGHYMYADGVMRKAREVRIGHIVKLGNGGASEVTDIHEWTGHGLFNPQTVDGDIVVDGIVVSTYTEAVDAKLAHALLTPVRAISEWVDVSALLSRMATGLRGARKLMTKTTCW